MVLSDAVIPHEYRIDLAPDAENLTFTARAEIDVVVQRPTSSITLNSVDLTIDEASLAGIPGSATIAYDQRLQRVTLSFDHVLDPGPYSLSLRYRGRIYDSPSGFFHLDYKTQDGRGRALYTKFENSDARRFVPCWDEPAKKAVFVLTATVPAGQMAVSNMPVTSTDPLPDGLQRVHFAPTPSMSSYLLFFAVGDFERIHREVAGVDVGVVVRRGESARAATALDTAASALPFYNDYFGTPYPLPKLDLVAGPGASQRYSAMENWGAIFFFERSLLVDPRITSERSRQYAYAALVHEIAHQWFGNLVTMDWWDDLWLNEGFASWMQNKVTEHFHPEWHVWLRALDGKNYAMTVDAREGTHPVIAPISDVLAADGAFDTITYTKGASVIRMLESYVGEEAFRAGVRRYIERHKYGNAVTDDLWRAMDEGSSRPIESIAHDFTLQAGVPMISEDSVRCVNGNGDLRLTQGHFAADADSTTARRWQVPVTVATAGGAAQTHVISGAKSVSIPAAGCAVAVINAGQAGYFRTRYAPPGLAALQRGYASLSADDQLGILLDTFSLAFGGAVPMGSLFGLAGAVPVDTDPVVIEALADQLRYLNGYYEGLPGRTAFRRYARGLLAPVLQRAGWNPAVGESENVTRLRASVIVSLGSFDAPEVIAETRARFAAYLADPTTLPASLRDSVLSVVALHADRPTWEQLHAAARSATSEVERQEMYEYLGAARDTALANQALTLALSGEPPQAVVPEMIREVARRHPELAFDFAVAHWDRIAPLIESGSRQRFVPRLLGNAQDLAVIPQLERFAEANIPAEAKQDVRKAVASIRYAARVRSTRLPEADRWLKRNVAALTK